MDYTTLDINTLRHNIMKSYIEVSEWLGDGALQYGSRNGYVSRKMSLSWLFNAVKALINWKMQGNDKFAEVDIHPLDVGYVEGGVRNYNQDSNGNNIYEGFCGNGTLKSTQGGTDSGTGKESDYPDSASLDQINGCCMTQTKVRAKEPWKNGTLKVRGNAWFWGERAYFYTHNSFVGECRFFHNARFLGQTTFDKEIAGTAMRSRWTGDIAEMYESDSIYDPGTLVMFGGDKEITRSDGKVCHAIVTEKPGVILNGQD